MNDTDTRFDSEGDERQFEDRLLDELLRLHVELNPIDGEATNPPLGRSHRRRGVRSRVPVLLVASLTIVVALVVAVTVVTLGHGTNNPRTTQVFTTPTQTSSAMWNLTGLVAPSGWHPQSVGATSPLQLVCPTERTCIASGVDLGVDQNSLPAQQNVIEVSRDGGASWRVAV